MRSPYGRIFLSKTFRLSSVVGLAIAGHAYAVRTHDGDSGPVLCIFRAVTGYPCPFCGLTRAGLAVFNLHFVHAIKENVLIIPIAALLVGYVIKPSYVKQHFDAIALYWWRSRSSRQLFIAIAVTIFFATFDLIRINYFPIPAIS